MTRLPRVAVVYPVAVPYTFPVLRRITESGAVDLTVFYAHRDLAARVPVSAEELSFEHVFLLDAGYVAVRRNVHEIDFNPTLPIALERGDFDLVLVSGFVQPTALIGMGWARLRGRRYGILSESHGLRRRAAARRRLRAALVGRAVRGAAVLFPTGRLAAEELGRLGGRDERMIALPHVPDPQLFHPDATNEARGALRTAVGAAPDTRVVVYVGRLTESKGVTTLLAAHGEVYRQTGAVLAIVGDGPLASAVREKRVPGVFFLGLRSPHEVAALLRGADLAVVPSYDEPWGTVVLEALASGCPVVATDRVASAVELLQAFDAGVLVAAHDEAGLARAVAGLLGDDQRRLQVRAGALRAASGFTPERVAEGFLRGVAIALEAGAEE